MNVELRTICLCEKERENNLRSSSCLLLVQAFFLCGLETSLQLDVVFTWAPNRSTVSHACRDRTFAHLELTGLQGEHEVS